MSTPGKRPVFGTSLDENLREQYRRDGFLVMRGFLSRYQAWRAKRALSAVIGSLVDDPEAGHCELPGTEANGSRAFRYRSRESSFFFQLEPDWDPRGRSAKEVEERVAKLLNHHTEHRLLHRIGPGNEALRGLLGQLLDDVAELYQSAAFIKPALVGSEKPWHQDNAYFRMRNLEQVLGTWIALDRATVENGCMHVLPGGHRLGPLRHCIREECEILPDRFDRGQAVPVEMAPGDLLIFHSNLPHMTPPNRSPHRRRALQYHFHGAGNAKLSFLEYESVFAEADGTPASCAAAQARGL